MRPFLRAITLSLLLVVSVASCSETTGPPDGAPPKITQLPRALTSEESALLAASNDFGFSLLDQLASADGTDNLFFSPLSASVALGMALNGAAGDTRSQMSEMLGFGALSQEVINDSYATLLTLLQELDPAVTVAVANSIWYRDGFPVLSDFLDRVRLSFEAEVAAVDFADPATVGRVNGWVSERTQGTIPKIVTELSANTVMLLLNAVYFKGGWTTQFDRNLTSAAPFGRRDGVSVDVDLMHHDGLFEYKWDPSFQLVELPYGGTAFTMTVVLPSEGLDPAELVEGLDATVWQSWVADATEQRVSVSVPRFEMSWESTLNDVLKELGMIDAFEPGAANFGRLVSGGGVWVDRVFQKSFVAVDEVGTEAAAVTGVVFTDSAPPTVRLDRPFILAIRERLSGTVLFLGVVQDPTA